MFGKTPFKKNIIVRKPRQARVDVLMVYPIWVDTGDGGWPQSSTLRRMLPPLGVLSIASVLEKAGFEVQVLDLHAEQLTPHQFRQLLRSLRPRFVGITVLSAHFLAANHIAKICKDEITDVRVFVGGVHAESAPEQMLRNPHIDAVGRGDGEKVMLELVRETPYPAIPGLSYRWNGRVRHNPVDAASTDLDDYPFPAYHLIDFDRYFPPMGSYRGLPAMNVLMTRGCPGKCTFCNSADTELRSRSVAKMVDLIKVLRYEHGIRQLYFYDDTFTANPKTVRSFCEAMISERVDVSWTCYVRGDMFRDELAALMAQAGCHQVLIGVESGSSALMKAAGKPIKKERYIETVRTAHRHGIEVRGSFIIGHREETHETMEETLQFAQEMDLDFFQLSIMTPYPGTQLYREAKEAGWLLHEDYSRYGQNEVILKPAHLSPDEIVQFARRAYYRFYLRPRSIAVQLKRLTNTRQVLDLVTAFAVSFYERGIDRGSKQSQLTREWLDFDLEAIADRAIATPEPLLTFQARVFQPREVG